MSEGFVISGAVNTVVDAVTLITTAGAESLTHGRGVVDAERGYIVRAIDDKLSQAEQDAQFVASRPAKLKGDPVTTTQDIFEELQAALNFTLPSTSLLPEPFQTFADLLLFPTFTPGEPCKAPAPLLKDLLDIALGRIDGGIDQIIAGTRGSVMDAMIPGFGAVEEIGDAVERVMEDPVTAALNLILGQKAHIDCETDAALGVGDRVIGSATERLIQIAEEPFF